MIRPHEALELQQKLRESLTKPGFKYAVDTYLCACALKAEDRSWFGRSAQDAEEIENYRSLKLGDEFVDHETRVLSQATTYVVTEQMNPLISVASRDLDDDMALEAHTLPAQQGFLVFEKPFVYQEAPEGWGFGRDDAPERTTMQAKALSWSVVQFDKALDGSVLNEGETGVVIHFYSSFEDDIAAGLITGDDAEYIARTRIRQQIGDLAMQHRIEVRFDQKLAAMRAPEYSFQESEAALLPVKIVMTIWFLMQQTVVETAKHAFSAKNARRYERKSIVPDVRTVNLRRRKLTAEGQKATSGNPSGRDYQHSWYVKAHWKRQPYGAKVNGRWGTDRKWIYIHPYIAGPEDKPLLDQKKVYKLSR